MGMRLVGCGSIGCLAAAAACSIPQDPAQDVAARSVTIVDGEGSDRIRLRTEGADAFIELLDDKGRVLSLLRTTHVLDIRAPPTCWTGLSRRRYSRSMATLAWLALLYGVGALMFGGRRPSGDPLACVALRLGTGIGATGLLGVWAGLGGPAILWPALGIASAAGFLMALLDARGRGDAPPLLEGAAPAGWRWAVGLAALALLAANTLGTLGQPWLEDTDPWRHAAAAAWLAADGGLRTPDPYLFQYLDPYPPGFPLLLGWAVRLGATPIAAAKTLGVLIPSLGVLLAWPLFRALGRGRPGAEQAAGWAALALAAIPCAPSRFIYAPGLAIALAPLPLLWQAQLRRANDAAGHRRALWACALAFGGLACLQPSVPLKLATFLAAAWAVAAADDRRRHLAMLGAPLLGLALALPWWAGNLERYGSPLESEWRGVFRPAWATGGGGNPDALEPGLPEVPADAFEGWLKIFDEDDLGHGPGLEQFVGEPLATNLVNNPNGLGWVVLGLSLAGLGLAWRGGHRSLVFWALLGLLGVLGPYLPVQVFAHRWWGLFALPVAGLAGLTLQMGADRGGRTAVVLLAAVLAVNARPRLELATARFPGGGARQFGTVRTGPDSGVRYADRDRWTDPRRGLRALMPGDAGLLVLSEVQWRQALALGIQGAPWDPNARRVVAELPGTGSGLATPASVATAMDALGIRHCLLTAHQASWALLKAAKDGRLGPGSGEAEARAIQGAVWDFADELARDGRFRVLVDDRMNEASGRSVPVFLLLERRGPG